MLQKAFVLVRADDRAQAALTESPYFPSLSFEALPATGYSLVAVWPEVWEELLQMLSARGWFER